MMSVQVHKAELYCTTINFLLVLWSCLDPLLLFCESANAFCDLHSCIIAWKKQDTTTVVVTSLATTHKAGEFYCVQQKRMLLG